VVGEHLGVVVRSPEALDPPGDLTVLLHPVWTGDLSIRDIANERVGERKLRLALD